jgi:hypothetical protein
MSLLRPPSSWTGIGRIAAERQRQITREGHTHEHDASHAHGELRDAATAYLIFSADPYTARGLWPWDPESFKPSDDESLNLVKAGALIAAELDRTRTDPQESTP